MLRALVIAQGALASELVAAARRITGDTERISAVRLDWSDDVEEARAKIQLALDDAKADAETLLLVDMVGSTPYNAAMSFVDAGKVELLAGVNLPMVVRLGCQNGENLGLDAAVHLLVLKGQASIRRGEVDLRGSLEPICPPPPGRKP